MSVQSTSRHSDDREQALTLARGGGYEDWRAVCRKMLFDGWGVEVFNETAFTAELNAICARERSRT
jgi:hypothetical protein